MCALDLAWKEWFYLNLFRVFVMFCLSFNYQFLISYVICIIRWVDLVVSMLLIKGMYNCTLKTTYTLKGMIVCSV